MRDQIIVIGGYGHTGQMICRSLGAAYPGKVFAAGRSLERAEQFCATTDGQVLPLQLDIRSNWNPELIQNVRLVVMCMDQNDTAFVRACLSMGIHYVDISASGTFLSQVEALHPIAVSQGATAVLSVGLAPGLTNLLSRHAADHMDETHEVDISVMLGLGDSHGKAAIEWTIDNMNTEYEVIEQGVPTTVSSFKDGKVIDFGDMLGRHTAYRFNFSDQHILPRTLAIPTVSTRLCLDSAVVSRLLAWLRAAGVFRLLRFGPLRRAAVYLFSKLRAGEPVFAVKVDARGSVNNKPMYMEYTLQGSSEAAMTARVAAAIAEIVYRMPMPQGVYHSEQLFELQDALGSELNDVPLSIRRNGKSFTVSGAS